MKALVLAICIMGSTASPALAQYGQSAREARHDNRVDTQNLDDRMGRTIAAVTSAEGNNDLSHRQADRMRNTIDRMRAEFSRSKRSQGFISAGELAGFNAKLDQIDRQIGSN